MEVWRADRWRSGAARCNWYAPARPLASLKPVARAFRKVAREMAASGALARA